MGRVLLFEPDAGVREIITLALENQGYTVRAFQEISQIMETLTGSDEFDVAVVSLRRGGSILPGRDGFTLLRLLSEFQPNMRVVGISVSSKDIDLVPHIDAFLVKPFDLEELFSALKRLTGHEPAPQA